LIKEIIIVLLILMAASAVIIGYSYSIVSNGPIQPLGRLSFVKIANPDMYPGHTHANLLGQYAAEQGSQCILICHFAGSSNYRSFPQDVNNSTSYKNGSVYIIEVAFIDTKGSGSSTLNQVNYLDSLKVALFGVPDGRYKYMSDGVVYNSYDQTMDYVNALAKENGQNGPLPMVWHGTVRRDNPILDPGCGFPLYFQILTKTYGLIPAYTYMIYGLIFPYFNSPYTHYELSNYADLQKLYNSGNLNLDKSNVTSNVDKYYKKLSKENLTNYD
jgi:hypothetical protein